MELKSLAWIAAALFVVWVVAGLIFKIVGAVIHLLLIAAVVLAVISLVSRARGSGPPR